MRNLMLFVLMLGFTGVLYAEKCRVKNSWGSYVYVDCDRGGTYNAEPLQGMLDQAGRLATSPLLLDRIRQRQLENQQHNMQMQILQYQAEQKRLEAERQKLELERQKLELERAREAYQKSNSQQYLSDNNSPVSSEKHYQGNEDKRTTKKFMTVSNTTGLYSGPTTTSKRLGKLNRNSTVTVIGESEGWVEVISDSGIGWVIGNLVY